MCVFVGEILNLTCLDSENRPLNTTLMNGNIFTSPTLITRDNAGILNTTYRCSPNTDDVCGQAAETISVFVSGGFSSSFWCMGAPSWSNF